MISQILKHHWLLILILSLAAFMRLYRIGDYMEFLGDQGRDVVIVRDFLKHGNLFFIGPQTSIGNMYLGPFYYYLFVAPGLVLTWFNPIGPAIIIALLGVLTVYFIFKFTQGWFGAKAAYIAAFLYAISPVVIKYSDFSWNPNVMPIFALLFIYFLTRSLYVPASLAFIICLNSHYLALLLLPPALIIFILNRRYQIKPILIAILFFIISLTPQILFDIKHQGQNFKAIAAFFTQRETTVNLKPYKALPILPTIFNQVNTRLLAGKNDHFGYFVTTIFSLLIIWQLFLQFKSKKINLSFIYLLLWLGSGLVGLALYKQHIYDHYFGFLFPVVFILLAYLITKLPRTIGLIFVILLTGFSVWENPFRWSPPHQLTTTQNIVKSIIAQSQGAPFNFSLLAKMNYDPGYRYFFDEYQAPVKLLNNELASQLFVVCEPFQMDCQPINNPEWSIAAFGWAKIDKTWEIDGIKIFRLVHTQPQTK